MFFLLCFYFWKTPCFWHFLSSWRKKLWALFFFLSSYSSGWRFFFPNKDFMIDFLLMDHSFAVIICISTLKRWSQFYKWLWPVWFFSPNGNQIELHSNMNILLIFFFNIVFVSFSSICHHTTVALRISKPALFRVKCCTPTM